MIDSLRKEAFVLAEPEQVNLYKRFFKCGKGEYGEGDTFIGIRTTQLRNLAKKYKSIRVHEAFELLTDSIHEFRLLALFILELIYSGRKTTDEERTYISEQYLKHLPYVNNWDLVDASAPKLLGPYVFHNQSPVLYQLAKSPDIWENRVAMLSAFYHIRQNEFQVPLEIASLLLPHKHDLIHKAVGWMLREIGKRNPEVEQQFIKTHYHQMPRTTLRYAIEKFEEPLRLTYLNGTF